MTRLPGTSALLLFAAALFAGTAWAEDSPQAAAGILGSYALSAETLQQWKLPDKLNEISGLALTEDARLLAITDESAIVYELDYAAGRLVKAFALGEPTVAGDFEGIAWFDGRVWLVTSEGVIYESGEGEDGERVIYDEYPTGLDRFCEIEGLAYRWDDGVLLVLCKKIQTKSNLESLTIFAWSTESHELIDEKTISLPDRQIAASLRNDRLNPSGIAIDRVTGNLLIVAARQQAVIELSPDGGFIAARVLPLATRHRQAEGIEILPTGDMLIADEGGSHKARLAIYRPAN
ncbi:MAG: hypothetical protein ACREQ1_02905 [Woeseiaceae bacterium]